MTANHTLLSFIVKRHVKTKENAATGALGFILEKSKAARKGLSDVLQAKVNGISPIASVEIQSLVASGGIPDLACLDSHGDIRALLEAKFWADLTPQQPNEYWESLPRDTPSALVFLVPTYRLDDMLRKLTRHLVKVGFQSGEEDRSSDCITVRDMKSQRRLMLISWDLLLRHLEKSADANGDSQAMFELVQLRSVAERESSEMGLCLCGCGTATKRKSKVSSGHDARVREMLREASKSPLPNVKKTDTDLRLPAELVELAKADRHFKFVNYEADTILKLAEKVGVREPRISAI